jgi:hypothetical protein
MHLPEARKKSTLIKTRWTIIARFPSKRNHIFEEKGLFCP